MDSYYAILDDFVREVKLALSRSGKPPHDMDTLQGRLRVSLAKVKERRCMPVPKGRNKK